MATFGTDAEIRATLDEMIAALNSGDRDRLGTFLAQRPDDVHIGSDPSEWLSDEQLVESIGDGEASSIKAVVDDWTIHSGEGDLAWAVGHGRFQDESRRTPAVRLTAVLTREGDRWLLVHSHASIGVANEKMFA